MVSLCIKSNNTNVINYLIDNISSINLENIIFLKKRFSKYTNIILHYTGNNITEFYNEISGIITNCIITNYENLIIHNLLLLDYFYFDNIDLNFIEKSCIDIFNKNVNSLDSSIQNSVIDRKHYLWESISNHISCNKSLFLDAFITFKLSDYIKCLDSILDFAVNKFVVNKEYSEFINMLKLYIKSKPTNSNIIHLIYQNEESILLDENKNIIALTKNNLYNYYLSDISFSSNDYALNSLLSLLPKKLIVHLISPSDDFINTLTLIFENRISICCNCSICKTYKLLNIQNNLK